MLTGRGIQEGRLFLELRLVALLKRAQRTKSENGLRLDEGEVSFKGIQKLPEQSLFWKVLRTES